MQDNQRKKARQRFSIRKYTIGTVSIVSATFFFVNGQVSYASEQDASHQIDQQKVVQANQDNKAPTSDNSNEKPLPQTEQSQNANLQYNDTSASKDNALQPSSNELKAQNTNKEQLDKSTASHVQIKATPAPELNDNTSQQVEQRNLSIHAEHKKNLQQNENVNNTKSVENNAQIEQPQTQKSIQNSNQRVNELRDHEAQPAIEKLNHQDETLQHSQNKHITTNQTDEKKTVDTIKGVKTHEQSNSQTTSLRKKAADTDETVTKEKVADKAEGKQEPGLHQSTSKNLKTKNAFETNHKTTNDNKIQSTKQTTPSTKQKQLSANKAPATKPDTQVQQSEVNELLKNAKNAKQGQYVNKYPIILVHGFMGLTGDNAPKVYPNYWSGKKYKVKEELEKAGYQVYEADVGAFSSNYDRAVELYHYIKGGAADYGQAHAEKHGHHRYGRTYEGIMPNWKPGQKVHLIGHSMGGQTIRFLEQLLRNGNPEEIAYQQAHGGEVSSLFKGQQDNMIASITTLATPHNGSPASDNLGNREFAKKILNDIGKLSGSRFSNIDLGFSQWGFKQRPNENYIEYTKRIKNSRLWDTTDNALTDLTAAGSEQLNQNTSLNPNIVYTSFAGEASHAALSGKHVPNIRQYPLMDLTSRIIGKDPNELLRLNDGIVPTVSALHPNGQAFKDVADIAQASAKGVWQVLPVKKDWDHMDFVGLDATDYKRTGEELKQFYTGIVNNLMRIEENEK
ncbi:YSIRK-targeted triacylglycerol lipase [Staphylococcus caeli]|uniref:YSIRK-targeted triacylglycerol lipase n=1 Tax=Staphylococcus caeli TaxID=2201815 RepID=UPI003F56D4A3